MTNVRNKQDNVSSLVISLLGLIDQNVNLPPTLVTLVHPHRAFNQDGHKLEAVYEVHG
jgi:hypothetical protein